METFSYVTFPKCFTGNYVVAIPSELAEEFYAIPKKSNQSCDDAVRAAYDDMISRTHEAEIKYDDKPQLKIGQVAINMALEEKIEKLHEAMCTLHDKILPAYTREAIKTLQKQVEELNEQIRESRKIENDIIKKLYEVTIRVNENLVDIEEWKADSNRVLCIAERVDIQEKRLLGLFERIKEIEKRKNLSTINYEPSTTNR